jgi:hypothetical protein
MYVHYYSRYCVLPVRTVGLWRMHACFEAVWWRLTHRRCRLEGGVSELMTKSTHLVPPRFVAASQSSSHHKQARSAPVAIHHTCVGCVATMATRWADSSSSDEEETHNHKKKEQPPSSNNTHGSTTGAGVNLHLKMPRTDSGSALRWADSSSDEEEGEAVAVTLQVRTIQCNTMQYNAIQCNTMQYNAIQYNTIQYNTIQYSIV